MLPRFSRVKQRKAGLDTVLLNMSWGTLEFGVTLSRKPLVNQFDEALYPHQRIRHIVAIGLIILVHALPGYWLLRKDVDHPVPLNENKEQLVFLNLPLEKQADKKPELAQPQPQPKKLKQPKQPKQRRLNSTTTPTPSKSKDRLTPPPEISITEQIAAARQRRKTLEAQQDEQAKLADPRPSAEDIAVARIKGNIQKAANYQRTGANGIFQVLEKGVRTGRFSFRGWTNDSRNSVRQTFEVDAGVGGNVELALVRRMIELIREHYSGDFNWESQRLGRIVVLSARPKDNAQLERFLMKEFFDAK